MATLLDFRRRIRSVKNTQQITRAMKFVAAARLRRAQERALAARPYAQQIARVLRSTMARLENPQHPLLAARPVEKILVVVLTGERGLCGAFNSNILRKAVELFRANAGKKIIGLPVGKKGRDFLKKQGMEFAGEYVNVLARVEFGTVREISKIVTEAYASGEVDAVYAVFSEFKSVIAPNLAVEKLLPIESIAGEESSSAGAVQVDYIYEQPAEELLDRLLPRYVETQVLRAMLESSAAEHAARMTAMESATKNAGEVIEALTLHMNKVRQAAITREIIEIVSGASSTA
ncbi:MAG: ATP synthase F1 subunit gamma [Acidobacteriia bacterium]|nr:ATP synthase F1 subunit gamma [Terriglobia bacterium]